MSEFLLFLGRFHVLVLHLPIGMVLLTIIVHWLSRDTSRSSIQHVLPLLWACTALSAMVTVVLGMLHFGEGGFTGPSAEAHRLWGVGFALGTFVVWFLSVFNIVFYRRWGNVLCLALLLAVTMTGHYGGNLTHGSSYLVEYAPQTLRGLFGFSPQRPAVTDLSQADPWHDVVGPMLQTRCGSCHGSEKQNGQLDLSSFDGLMVGGESGSVVLAGNARGSDLYRRVTLPFNHENYMPAEGKTPLTDGQIQILGWWIDSGMPVDIVLGDLAGVDTVSDLFALELGLSTSELPDLELSYAPVSSEDLDDLVASGWLVRQVTQQSHGLIVSIYSSGQPVTRSMLEVLGQAGASVVDLDLASSGLNDQLLNLLPEMPALEKLNLSNNGVSDAGLEIVGSFQELKMLNLYGNPEITDAGVMTLTGFENLQTLYLWGTAITEQGTNTLQLARPSLEIQGQTLPR